MKSLSSVVSVSRDDASGWEREQCGSQCRFGERYSMIEEILTSVTARQRRTLTGAKWEDRKGKKVQYLINKQITQNKTKEGGKSWPSAIAW